MAITTIGLTPEAKTLWNRVHADLNATFHKEFTLDEALLQLAAIAEGTIRTPAYLALESRLEQERELYAQLTELTKITTGEEEYD